MAIERLQITLREDPDLVQALSDLEDAYMPVSGFAEQLTLLRGFDHGGITAKVANQTAEEIVTLFAPRITHILELLLDVRGKLAKAAAS